MNSPNLPIIRLRVRGVREYCPAEGRTSYVRRAPRAMYAKSEAFRTRRQVLTTEGAVGSCNIRAHARGRMLRDQSHAILQLGGQAGNHLRKTGKPFRREAA